MLILKHLEVETHKRSHMRLKKEKSLWPPGNSLKIK
jgi:hypothetical protein